MAAKKSAAVTESLLTLQINFKPITTRKKCGKDNYS